MGNATDKSEQQSKSKLPFSSRDDDEYNILSYKDQIGKKLKCSMKTRIICYVVCCATGWFMSILGTLSLIFKHNVTLFAIFYSLGQIINIVGSCIIATPKKQFKNMSHPKRIVLTIIYLSLIVLTLVLGVTLPQNLTFLVFLCLIAQIIAYFFYTLSYIPYGQKILKKLCRSFMIE